MKKNRFERDYKDTPAPAAGVEREFSNKTKLHRTQGKIHLNCDLCGMPFETYACWAKRYANHFCSFACSSAFKEEKVKKACGICGKEFEVTRTQYKRVSTCSKVCSTTRRKARLGFCEPRHPNAEVTGA